MLDLVSIIPACLHFLEHLKRYYIVVIIAVRGLVRTGKFAINWKRRVLRSLILAYLHAASSTCACARTISAILPSQLTHGETSVSVVLTLTSSIIGAVLIMVQ